MIDNDKIYEILLEIKADVAGVHEGLANNKEHTSAISKKADAIRAEVGAVDLKLQNHKEDTMAHRGAIFGAFLVAGGAVLALLGWKHP